MYVLWLHLYNEIARFETEAIPRIAVAKMAFPAKQTNPYN